MQIQSCTAKHINERRKQRHGIDLILYRISSHDFRAQAIRSGQFECPEKSCQSREMPPKSASIHLIRYSVNQQQFPRDIFNKHRRPNERMLRMPICVLRVVNARVVINRADDGLAPDC